MRVPGPILFHMEMRGLGGLPARRPDQQSVPPPAPPLAPGGSDVVRARVVIVTGGPGSGVFVYSPSPGAGNLIGSWAGASGVDTYGNAYPAGLSVDLGAISGSTFSGADFLISQDGIFFYSTGTTNPPFGIDNAAYSDIITSMGVASVAAYRGNNTPAQNVPASWPGPGTSPIPAGVLFPCIGFKPGGSSTASVAMAAVLAGTFDAAISAYFASIVVPAGGAVYQTSWHEGETTGVSAATLIAYHQHVYSLFKASAPPGAFYGQCFTAFTANPSSSHYPVPQWVSCVANGGAADLDFYAVDGYQPAGSSNTPAQVMGPWLTQLQTKVASPKIAIFENNIDSPNTDFVTWFSQAWAWAIANDCLTFCIFYSAGTWTGDPATTAELVAINNASGTGVTELLISMASQPGTDPVTGSAYPEGVAVGANGGGQALLTSQLTLTTVKFFANPSNISSVSLVDQAVALSTGSGEPALVLSCIVHYAGGDTANAQIILGGAAVSGLTTFLMNTEFSSGATYPAWQCQGNAQYLSGGTVISLEPTQFLNGSVIVGSLSSAVAPFLGVYAAVPSASPVVPPAPFGWKPLTPGNGWANSGAGPVLEYQLLASPPNTFRVVADLTPGTQADGTVIATVPLAYFPANTQPLAATFPGATGSLPAAARFTINTLGELQCTGISGMTFTRVQLTGQISLDA